MKRFLISMIILSVSLSACSAKRNSVGEKSLRPELDPKNVREVVDIYKLEPVLVLTFVATADGYKIEEKRITMGVPSQAVDLNRGVLITARTAAGEVVARLSVFNPREIHTVGADKPETTVIDRGRFTVSLPKPDLVRFVEIEVRRGPNSSLKQSFQLKDSDNRIIPGENTHMRPNPG